MQRSYNNHTFKVSLKNPQSKLLKMECEEERGKTRWGCGDKGRSLQQRAQEGSGNEERKTTSSRGADAGKQSEAGSGGPVW